MNSRTQREYVLGTHRAELERLGFQHRLWSHAASSLWERAGIKPGMDVLDIGAGPGFAALDLAQLTGPSGSVLGIDESEAYVAFANEQAKDRMLPHARFVLGDAIDLDALDLADASFDIVYIRWLLCFVSKPQAVIRSVARLLKPGGVVCIQDYFRYESMCVAPRSEIFETVIKAIDASWRDHGGNPDTMGDLPQLALEHGLALEHIARVEVGTARPGSTMWHWPDSFWKVFLPRLVEMHYLSEDEHQQFLTVWQQLSHNPAAFMHLPPMYEMIARKPYQ